MFFLHMNNMNIIVRKIHNDKFKISILIPTYVNLAAIAAIAAMATIRARNDISLIYQSAVITAVST